MPNIQQIYDQYQIMANLQQHMLRVTAVAKIICDHLSLPVDTDSVVRACLLHDMGNILKFDLSVFPEFLEPLGAAYWQGIKTDFSLKFGKLVHPATIKIATELGASQRVKELITAINFNQEKANWTSSDFGRKICAYADMRVAPTGVTSLDERLADGKVRYPVKSAKEEGFRYAMNAYLHKIEVQIFEKCDDLNATGVNEISIGPIVEKLKTFTI